MSDKMIVATIISCGLWLLPNALGQPTLCKERMAVGASLAPTKRARVCYDWRSTTLPDGDVYTTQRICLQKQKATRKGVESWKVDLFDQDDHQFASVQLRVNPSTRHAQVVEVRLLDQSYGTYEAYIGLAAATFRPILPKGRLRPGLAWQYRIAWKPDDSRSSLLIHTKVLRLSAVGSDQYAELSERSSLSGSQSGTLAGTSKVNVTTGEICNLEQSFLNFDVGRGRLNSFHHEFVRVQDDR